MDKRLLTAFVMISLIVILCVSAIFTTGRIADDVTKTAKQLQQTPEEELLKLLEKQWKQYEKILSFYTRHSEIENIGNSVRTLDSLLREDEELFKIECDKIIIAAEHLKNVERPYLWNVF